MQTRGQTQERDPPQHRTKTWTGARTETHGAAWESRGLTLVGGGVCVWLKHSGLLFTSCLVPPHHWLEGGGGGYYAAGWGGMSLDLAEVCSGA